MSFLNGQKVCTHPAKSVMRIALKTSNRVEELPVPTQRTSSSTSSTHSYQWSISTCGETKDQSCISTWGNALFHTSQENLASYTKRPVSSGMHPDLRTVNEKQYDSCLYRGRVMACHHTWLLFLDCLESTLEEGTLGLLCLCARSLSGRGNSWKTMPKPKRKGEREAWGERESTTSPMVRSCHHSLR